MKAKKIIIPIVIILVILALLGGGFALLWFKTDLLNFLKPKSEVFENQIEKALNIEDVKFTDYSDFLKDYKTISDKAMKSKINVSANLNISELDSDVEEIINKSKLTMENNIDSSKTNVQSKIKLTANNSKVLDVEVIQNDGKFAIGCEDLYDKYISVSQEDLIKYLEKNSNFDAESYTELAEKLADSTIDPYELLYISEDDLKHLDDTYGNVLSKLISKDNYTSKNNVEVSVDGDDVKTTAYYLTLTGKDAYKFAEDFTNLIQDDSTLAKIITEKANYILEKAGEDKISESDVKKAIKEIFKSTLSELDDMKDIDDEAIQVAVFSKNNNPVRVEINLLEDASKPDKAEKLISVEYAKSKNIYTIYNDGKSYASLVDEYTKKTDDEKVGKLSVKASGMSIGSLEYELVSKKDETKCNLTLSIPLADVSASVKYETKGDYTKEEVTFNGSFEFKYGKESASVKFDGSVEYTDDVSIPKITSSNSLDILNTNEKDLQKEVQKILKKASEVLPSRLKLIGINVKAEDIYKEPTAVVTPDKTTTDDKTNTENKLDVNYDDIQKEITETQKTIEETQKQIDALNR